MRYIIKIPFTLFIFITLMISRVDAQELPLIQKVYPFKDSTTWVKISTFKYLTDDLPNVEISLISNGRKTVIDSVISMFSTVDLRDMNFDGTGDLLVSFTAGARANITYHLYLVDLPNNLTKVSDFEEVVNPRLDKNFNVITELRLTSQNCYSFHRLVKEQIISLDTSFCAYPDSILWTNNTLEQMSLLLTEKEKAFFQSGLPGG